MSSHNTPLRRHCMIVFAQYPLGETRVQREAEALLKHGYEVDLICPRVPGEAACEVYKGVKIYREKYRVPFITSKSGGLGDKFLKYILFLFVAGFRVTLLNFQKRYATIQVHNLPDFLAFCTVIPRLMGIPIILDLHDLMPEFYASRFGQNSSIAQRLIRLQERLSCSYANHVITVSEHWRQALIRRGVPAQKCSVVMNVADESIFHPLAQSSDQPHRKDGFRLIYHGAIVKRYGLDLAIQAVARVRSDIPGIHLSLVGGGEYIPELKLMVEELGLGQQVSFDNLHLAEELPEIITACHLGIVPYRNDVFTGGLLPTKLFEYASLGMPAIAARTPAIQAYFSDANAEFFEPGDVDDLARCILMLYHNQDRMAELARGSQRFNQRYNWTQTSEAYVSLVERLGGVNPETCSPAPSGLTNSDK